MCYIVSQSILVGKYTDCVYFPCRLYYRLILMVLEVRTYLASLLCFLVVNMSSALSRKDNFFSLSLCSNCYVQDVACCYFDGSPSTLAK